MPTSKKITISDDTQISKDELIQSFMQELLNLEPNTYLITDESMLSDFASCGMPDPGDTCKTLKDLYALWDSWVLKELNVRYSVQIEHTHIYLLQLMELIRQQAKLH